ncbi:MAG: WD40 repeat protein/mono/diheme cytochrome c family protein [Candidatus Paceibacteria bacterium]|jgi:WD40 repeat protein/mono/diheme cytochrome c family protein
MILRALPLLLGSLLPWTVLGDTDQESAGQQERAVSYRREIVPILRRNCLGCHQPARAKGKLDMLSHESLLRGGRGGPVVVAHAPQDSLLLELIRSQDGEPAEMPEGADPLDESDCALVEQWILQGAADDSTDLERLVISAEHPPLYPRRPVLTCLDHSPDGDLLAVSGYHEVLIWKSGGDELVTRLIGLSERIESVAFSPSGEWLAVAGGTPGLSGELQIWKTSNWKLVRSIPVTYDTIYGASWSPDESIVAVGASDNTLRAFDVDSGEQVLFQGAHTDWVLGTTFSLDGTHLVSVGRDRSLKLTKVETQQFIDNITSITPGVLAGGLMAVARHPVLDQLLVGGADGSPKVFRMYREKKRVIGDDYNLIRAFESLGGRVFDVAWARRGANLVAVSSHHQAGVGRGKVRLYQADEGQVQWTFEAPCSLYALDVHPDQEVIVVGGADGLVRRFQLSDGALLNEFSPVDFQGQLDVQVLEASESPSEVSADASEK